MIHITFWCNVYSIIIVFSFSSTDVERFSGLGKEIMLLIIVPQVKGQRGKEITVNQMLLTSLGSLTSLNLSLL